MKRLLALLMTGVLVFSMAACGNKPTEPDPTVMPDNMASMTAPVDALARCMLENKLDYDSQDPEFFWISLFYFAGAYGLDHPMVEEEGSYQLKVPTPVMQEHATALFADYDSLFDLPSIMKGNVSYDPDQDAYFLSRGDIGLSEMKFVSYEKTEDGHVVKAQLLSTDSEAEVIQTYDVILTENTHIDGIEEPLYFYSVKDIVPITVDTETGSETETEASDATETALFNGLADSHTAELTLPDGTVQPFQFDPNSDIAKTIGSLTEGDGITFSYKEQANGSLMITSIE